MKQTKWALAFTVSVVCARPVSSSSGILLEIPTLRAHPRPTKPDLHFNKIHVHFSEALGYKV